MTSLRTTGRRPAAAAAALLLGLALDSPAAFAAAKGQENHISMPAPLYETATAALSRAETCRAYERRFDDTVGYHANAKKVDQARTLRVEGAKLCGKGEYDLGNGKLREALIDLGVNTQL